MLLVVDVVFCGCDVVVRVAAAGADAAAVVDVVVVVGEADRCDTDCTRHV